MKISNTTTALIGIVIGLLVVALIEWYFDIGRSVIVEGGLTVLCLLSLLKLIEYLYERFRETGDK